LPRVFTRRVGQVVNEGAIGVRRQRLWDAGVVVSQPRCIDGHWRSDYIGGWVVAVTSRRSAVPDLINRADQ